jgi:2-keto-4-pentenoate hydratase/2-oxohepta-3-ene-1,7-dioic acid hydratase in catechol pathway
MRIVRFTPAQGGDPLFGILEDDLKSISVINGDLIFSGIAKNGQSASIDDVKLLAPVLPRSKVVCVGKNYSEHAKEMGGEVPAEPIIFLKPNTSVAGPNDVINWPWMSERVDHEAELAIVIGRICKDVPRERANEVIFGYTIANDVTARDLQSRDGQWTRAKGFDTFCPIGPWIDSDFLPGNQEISCTVNGEVKQRATLNQMIFDVPEIIHFISSVMTLLPGDVILTGTPAGIGPMPEKATVTCAISGLGELTNKLSARG